MKQTENWNSGKINITYDNQKIINYWIIILTIFLILFLFFSTCIPYKSYKKYSGIVKVGEKAYVQVYMDDHTIMELPHLHISRNKKECTWKVKNISEKYYLDEKMNKYRVVELEMNLESEVQIENNIIEILIDFPPKTLWNRIKKSFKEVI